MTPENDDDDIELTPEHRERIRVAFVGLQGAMLPQFQFNLPDLTGLAKVAESIGKEVVLPETLTKEVVAFTGISSAAAEALKAYSDSQSQWAKQLTVINSDALKSLAVMPPMDSIFAALAKNADFADSISHFVDEFVRQHKGTFESLAKAAKKFGAAFYPANLRDIKDLQFEAVVEVVLKDGIALYGLPRQELAEALIHADGFAARLAILDAEWKPLTEDCRAALNHCQTGEVADWVAVGIEALDAFNSGHEVAAQALVGSLTETVVTSYMGSERYKFTPNRDTSTPDEYKKLDYRSQVALGPIWQAYQKFNGHEDSDIPTTFSRHATAHTVSRVQYTRRNLVQGLLLICSLIFFVNESAAHDKAA